MAQLFDNLPRETWNSLVQAGRPRQHAPSDVLMRQGDPGTQVMLLTQGRVKVTRIEPDGRELLLAVRGPGEALGDLSAWDEGRRSSTVTAVSVGVTYTVAAARFRATIDRHQVGGVLLRHLSTRLREGEDIRAELTNASARERVIRILLRLADHANTPGPGQLALDDGLSQEDLARAVGLSRSAFAAELGALRRLGLVSTGRQRLIIHDPDRLRSFLGPLIRGCS